MTDRTYWAARSTAEIVDAIKPKVEAYYDYLYASGRRALWSRTWRQHYAGQLEGGTLGTDGEQDELVRVNVNDFHNLVQHYVVMTTSQRPHFDPRAVNSDHKSQTQTILGRGILDYVLQEKGLETNTVKAVEAAVLFADAYLAVDWDSTAGRDYVPSEDGKSMTKTGDLVFRFYTPLDVASDPTKTNPDEHQWYCARRWVNRYDLAARYEELSERILAMPGYAAGDDAKRPRYFHRDTSLARYESDDVEVFDFLHVRSDALPDGRKVTFLLDGGGDMPPLFDGPLPYDDLSLYRLSPSQMLGTAHGYSSAFDLLSLQEAENALWSTLSSNVAAFGVQNIWTSTGDNVAISSFGGLKHIQSRTKPEGLNLVANSADAYKLLELLTKAMETVSGVNSVARGNPEASLKSGAALALVQSQALQFAIGLQQAWTRWMEQVATGVIRLYKRFAQAPQVALLAGKSNRGFVQEFTGRDLDRIDRVAVDLGNALSRTVAGRVQVAESLLDKGLIKTPEEYIQVLTTGKLEPVLEATQKEMLAIKSENERLSDGAPARPPQPPGMTPSLPMQGPQMLGALQSAGPSVSAPAVLAVLTDNHPAHIREHAAVIASPDAREAPQVVAAVLDHIQQHLDLWQTMPPALGAALQIPPPPMVGPAPMGPPGAPGPGGPPPPGGSGPEPMPMEAPPGAGPMPSMPQMPKNPMTGERAEPLPNA